MLHFDELNAYILSSNKELVTGTEFTYKRTDNGLFQKGIMVTNWMMIPIGLQCETIEGAQKQI